MKINVLVICSIIVATNLYSQQIVIPPSPTAASLGRYADIQVNLYTGKPNITIPIWEINENDIRLPIYLTYLADGIKVEEIASWIGFGWSLNAGGVITRSVRGNPDDNSLTDIHTNWWDMEWPGWIDDQKHYAGYEPEANFSDYDYIPYLIENMSQNEEDINYWTYLADFTVIDPYFEYELDGEPDIFYYNFLGHTGTFYFDKDRQISPEIYQPFQFSYNQDANGNIISFQIIDDKGFVYIFENVEETELLNTSYSLGYNALLGEYNQAMNRKMIFNSSWYLSKIETPLGKVVTFTYAQEGLIYNTRLSQYYDASIANEVHVYGNYASETNISSLRLSSIETDVTLINFIPGNEREDLDGNSKVLREIQIFSKYDLVHPVRIFQLEHGYFLSPNVDTERPEDFKRLYLISVQEIGVNNVANPPYTFGYNYNYSSNVYLPERLSFEQDLWGYYNANGSTNSLIPELHVYPGLNDEFRIYEKKNYSGTHYVLESEYFVDRLPDEPKMMHCILNRITYPTGGYRIFEFEAHRFLLDGSEEIGGGLRIKKIINYDNTGVKLIEREYEYKMYDAPIVTSGLPVFIPQFAYKQNSYAVGCTPSFGSLAYYEDATIIHNVSIASLGSTHGSAVGYRYVKEIETGNGYILRRYATPGMYEDLHDSDAPLAVPQCQVMVSGFCDGLFRRPTITYRPSLFDQQCNYLNMPPYCVYVLGYCGVNITGLPSFKSYPYAPSLNYDWNRGYLLFEKYFNNNNQEVKKIDYDYSIYYAENNNPKYIKCLNVGLMKNFMLQEPLFAYSFYEVITNVSKMPIRKTETIYSSDTPGDITKALTTTSEFDYNEKLLLKEEKVLQSDGIWFKTDYIYPKDLISGSISTTNPEVAALSLMIEKNILNRPIEIMNYKNGYVLSSSLRLYHTQLINNWPAAEYIVVPFEDWEIETSAPLTLSTTPSSGTFVKSYISGSISFVKDNHYTRRISYDMFDNKGNLLEYHKENDSHVAFIWDYNNSAVTAAANNAYNSQIAYTSFECETDLLLNSGNWKIGPGIIVDDYGKTGSRRYNGLLQSWYNLPVGKYGLSFFMQRKLGENGNIYVGSEIITALYSNKWEFVERIIEITTPGKISIAATGAFIDELTLCPVASQIRTFTHKPLFGITTSTNENNQIQYFEYDIMGRLSLIRDQDKYILKKFVYHYK